MARYGRCLLVIWPTKPVPIKKDPATKFIPVMDAAQTWDEKAKSREKWERKWLPPHNGAPNHRIGEVCVLMK